MKRLHPRGRYRVHLELTFAGPERKRTKYKQHKLATCSGRIVLPFAPFPGLFLKYSKPRRRGGPRNLYLRVRAVEWEVEREEFHCVVDEVLGSLDFDATLEVRGDPRHEERFVELQRELRRFGFEVRTDMEHLFMALYKTASGIDLRDSLPGAAPWPSAAPARRSRFFPSG